MLPNDKYFELDNEATVQSPAVQSATAEFLMRCLLGARDEADFASNRDGFDEDVNVYLVGLLQRFLSTNYHHEATRFVRKCDIDLSREVEEASDDRLTFRLYKTNADHLMMTTGLFHHAPGNTRYATPLARREPGEFIGRGGIYYNLASAALRRLQRQRTGPQVALEKLGGNFGEYSGLLGRVRVTFFHLTSRLGDGTLYHLLEDEPVGPEEVARLYDGFLDAYSAWKADPGNDTLNDLREAAGQVKAVDPEFGFHLPDESSES